MDEFDEFGNKCGHALPAVGSLLNPPADLVDEFDEFGNRCGFTLPVAGERLNDHASDDSSAEDFTTEVASTDATRRVKPEKRRRPQMKSLSATALIAVLSPELQSDIQTRMLHAHSNIQIWLLTEEMREREVGKLTEDTSALAAQLAHKKVPVKRARAAATDKGLEQKATDELAVHRARLDRANLWTETHRELLNLYCTHAISREGVTTLTLEDVPTLEEHFAELVTFENKTLQQRRDWIQLQFEGKDNNLYLRSHFDSPVTVQ